MNYNIKAMDSVTTSAECLKKRDPSNFISDCARSSERFQVKFLPPDRIKNILIGNERFFSKRKRDGIV